MTDTIKLYWNARCSKCNRARDLLLQLNVPFEEREYSEEPLTAEEIRAIAGSCSVLGLINSNRPAYRERGFDENPPTEEQALAAMAEENILIYRPILVRGDRIVKGWDEEAIRELIA